MNLGDGQNRELAVDVLRRSGNSSNQVTSHRHQVTHHGGGRRGATRTRAEEHQVPSLASFHEDSVEGTRDSAQRVGGRNQRRMNASRDAVRTGLADGKQLDDAVHVPSGGNVLPSDGSDALPVHLVAAHARVERQGGQQGRLGGGVISLDVGGRIGLGISLGLRLGQSVVETCSRGRHLVKDVVRRAIHDSHHSGDLVTDKRLAQRPDDRDGSGHCGLVVEVDAMVLGDRVQFRAMGSQQSLVGSDDGMSLLQGSRQELTCGVDATNELDDDVNVVTVDQRCRVIREQPRVKALTGAIRMGDSNVSELDTTAHPSRDVVTAGLNHAGHLGAHDPAPQEGHADRLG